MSDPFSIAVGVIALVGQSVKAVQTTHGLFGKYSIADLSIVSTRTECATIRVALLQIQDLLIQKDNTRDDDDVTHALAEYEGVLSACSITFSVLNDRLTELNLEGVNERNESRFKSKLKAVWNDEEMNILRHNIRGQAIAVNLLLSAFQAGSSAKIHKLLKEKMNRSILKTVSSDARTLLSKSHRARTITEKRRGDVESSDSVTGDEVFDFDNEVINSAAYRRAYYSYTSRIRPSPENLKEEEGEKNETSSVNTIRNVSSINNIPDGLIRHDVDYFDKRCVQLCNHVHSWIQRFSKYSDTRTCRTTRDLLDDRMVDRLDSTIIDGSDVDSYLADRVKRRDIFACIVMTMIWEFIFSRYLFGMDQEMRQNLRRMEKKLGEVGPSATVNRWRAITLSLFAKRPEFEEQKTQDIEAVVEKIYDVLYELLPPPQNLEQDLLRWLRKVIKDAADLSIQMRTQQAEFRMLPPLPPEYDSNGDLFRKVHFNAMLMNEWKNNASTSGYNNDNLEKQEAIVRTVVFPLVIRVGNDEGTGGDEIVVCPAQVIVAQPRKKSNAATIIE